MPPLAIAGVGLALGAGGAVLSSNSQRKAATTAANTQLAVADKNNALAERTFAKNEGYLSPYIQSGLKPNALLGGAMGYGDQGAYRDAFRSFIDNSDYGFQLDQGVDRLDSAFSGIGAFQSGAALKGLERFRSDLNAGYRGEFNNLLANQQALGLGAGSALAGVGQNYVNTVSANNQNAGDAAANAALIRGQNNPLANALGMIGGGMVGFAGGM